MSAAVWLVWPPHGGYKRVYRLLATGEQDALQQVRDAALANGGRQAHQRLRALPWDQACEMLRRQAVPLGWEAAVESLLRDLTWIRRQLVWRPGVRQGVAHILEQI